MTLAKKDREWRSRMNRDDMAIIADPSERFSPKALHLCSLADSPPTDKGALLLLLRIGQSLDLRLRESVIRFVSGYYVYAGNADGLGGIGVRLASFPEEQAPTLTYRPSDHGHRHDPCLRHLSGQECAIVGSLGTPDGLICPSPPLDVAVATIVRHVCSARRLLCGTRITGHERFH